MDAQRKLTARLYEAQRGLAHQVLHDALTGLPNRLLFAQRLDDAMREGHFMLIFVDLDDFKEVNDRFGHAAGDELLRAVGDRLQRCVTDADTLARIGGDEFAILIDGETRGARGRRRPAPGGPARSVRGTRFLDAGAGEHGSGASRGRRTPPRPPMTCCRQADVSMYAGKRLGKNTAVVYQPSSGVSGGLPDRAAAGHTAAFLPDSASCTSPSCGLPEGTPVAVEALARWTAPNGIHIPPRPSSRWPKRAGLGAVLDAMVLDMACSEVEAAGLDVDIHVNIGAARLGNPDFEHRCVRRWRGIESRRADWSWRSPRPCPIVDLAEGGSADRTAQRDRRQGRAGRLRCGLQLADVSARLAGADRQAGPESGGRLRAGAGS